MFDNFFSFLTIGFPEIHNATNSTFQIQNHLFVSSITSGPWNPNATDKIQNVTDNPGGSYENRPGYRRFLQSTFFFIIKATGSSNEVSPNDFATLGWNANDTDGKPHATADHLGRLITYLCANNQTLRNSSHFLKLLFLEAERTSSSKPVLDASRTNSSNVTSLQHPNTTHSASEIKGESNEPNIFKQGHLKAVFLSTCIANPIRNVTFTSTSAFPTKHPSKLNVIQNVTKGITNETRMFTHSISELNGKQIKWVCWSTRPLHVLLLALCREFNK